jgi:uncharacterized cupredoxin-like copper-binding protein
VWLLLAAFVAGCGGGAVATPPIVPGTSAAPREVNVIAYDYGYSPPVIDLVPGETILLHVVNAGLDVHEVVIGDATVQTAWERAEAAVAGAPPGPTPLISLPPDQAGIRIVVRSGERVDLRWTVPLDPARVGSLIFGCHIPGHWERGMWASVRVVMPASSPVGGGAGVSSGSQPTTSGGWAPASSWHSPPSSPSAYTALPRPTGGRWCTLRGVAATSRGSCGPPILEETQE